MDFYEDFNANKKRNKLTNADIAVKIDVKPDALRMAIKRRSLSKLEILEIEKLFAYKNEHNSDAGIKENDTIENKKLFPIVSETKGAPYYDVDFVGGFDLVVNNQTINPTFYIDFMPYNDVDCWVNVTGKSMSPFISHGDIVALKKVENWKEFLLYGEIYAVVTSEFRTIKIIGKSDLLNHFKLIPYSKSPEFSEQDLPVKFISNVYRVKGSIKKFF